MKNFFRRTRQTFDAVIGFGCPNVAGCTSCSAAFKAARRTLTALLIVACVLTASVADAAVQTFDGNGKYIMSEFETESIARQRAIQKAKQDAQDKAGSYLASFSQSINARLTADEISAVTNNTIDISDVDVQSEPFKYEGEPAVMYKVTLKAKVDTNGILNWLKYDDATKITIVQQNNSLREAIKKNDKQIEALKEQYRRATSQAERDKIRKQIEQTDLDFLANGKVEAAAKIFAVENLDDAIRLSNEALQFNPNCADAYLIRGFSFFGLKQYNRALQDFDKIIKLDSNHAYAYLGRGAVYVCLEKYKNALQDFDKAIKLEPKFAYAYFGRGAIYSHLEQYENAIQDLDKVIELEPNYAYAYFGRGAVYSEIEQHERAIQDFDKAIELKPDYAEAYMQRGYAYAMLENVDQALSDLTKAIELDIKRADAYYIRGKIYEALGDKAKAQADFAKAKQLGWKN